MEQQHPFSEEAWSLPANGGTKFRQNRAVRGRRNGVATLLEFREQYALIQKRRSQLGFVTYLLNYLRIILFLTESLVGEMDNVVETKHVALKSGP